MSAAAPVVIRTSVAPPLTRHLNPGAIVRTLAAHRGLIASFAGRELLERNKGAVLGVAWNVVNPLLQLAIYTAIFGYLFGTRWERGGLPSHLDFPLVFFVGHTVFHVFAESANRAPTLVSGRPNLVRKVIFPLEILPATVAASSVVYALIALVIALVVLVAAGGSVPITALLAPVIMLPLIMLALGAGWMLSALGVFVRDVRHIVQVLTQLLMFTTPIFYTLDRFPDRAAWVVRVIEANPMTVIVENARRALLWGEPLEWGKLGMVTVACAVFMQAGYAVFMRLRPQMADVH